MTESALVFELSQKSFNEGVLFNSHKIPVVVEFMGMWSGPCIQLADRFTYLAQEFPGQFVFGKVDIDEQTELAKEYAIENVPTTVVFKDGKAVRREEGELNADDARALVGDFGVFHQSDVQREQAREKHMAGDTHGAILLLTQAIQEDPGSTRVVMDMVQIFIDIGELEQANGLFQRLPQKDRETDMGKVLHGQLTFADLAAKTEGAQALNERISRNPHDYEALFDLSLCEVAKRDYDAAMNALFTLLERAPDFRDGAAREMIVTVINMLAPNAPEAAMGYRRHLSNLLAE